MLTTIFHAEPKTYLVSLGIDVVAFTITRTDDQTVTLERRVLGPCIPLDTIAPEHADAPPVKNATEDGIPCPVCGKLCRSDHGLRKHMRSLHAEQALEEPPVDGPFGAPVQDAEPN
jgi:hypothetical protein